MPQKSINLVSDLDFGMVFKRVFLENGERISGPVAVYIRMKLEVKSCEVFEVDIPAGCTLIIPIESHLDQGMAPQGRLPNPWA